MREHLGFLKTSSVVVKIAAWIFLLFGVVSGMSAFLKAELPYPRQVILLGSAIYVFLFFLLFLIAKIADLLVKIINEIKKE
jgi:ABC-type antimicrobial peptide transport system permease subunit